MCPARDSQLIDGFRFVPKQVGTCEHLRRRLVFAGEHEGSPEVHEVRRDLGGIAELPVQAIRLLDQLDGIEGPALLECHARQRVQGPWLHLRVADRTRSRKRLLVERFRVFEIVQLQVTPGQRAGRLEGAVFVADLEETSATLLYEGPGCREVP